MSFSNTSSDFSGVASSLGLDNTEDDATPSTYTWHLDGDELAAAIVDRFSRQRQWYQANGLLQGWKLKLHYFYNEYRASPEIPHLAIMTQFGSQNEFSFVSVNHLRSLLKTLLGSCIQNPPTFQPKATNADASALEAAALYTGVLDYYVRDLRLTAKIARAVETGMVVDQAFALVEWDPFATNGDAPTNTGIWKGAPSVKILNPWDMAYDICKSSWEDLDWVICRDWVDREKCKAQFPEMVDDIEGCQSRAQVTQANSMQEPNRYELNSFGEMSNDIQVFKMYHRQQPWMPDGRFVMALENGKLLFESPVGMIYPKLPVERFVPDEQIDLLLGYSPINEIMGIQEAINNIESAITSNAANYANQYVACQTGTEINPRTLADGQKILEYPPGSQPPVGLNLTAIPNTLFEHVKSLEDFMQTVLGASNSSRGQTGGANQTGSAMLFLASQTAQNQGNMAQNYQDFSAAVMTSLLHVLRVFGRTERTINIMGKTVASRTIVLADALKDFDEVVVEMNNPLMSTPQGRMAFAQQMMQFGNSTPQEALQVAVSGNLGPAVDPAREASFELELENEWLLEGSQVMVNALDDHEAHILMHKRLFATPWLRKPDLAEKLQIANAPALMQGIMGHIQQHMQFLGQNATGSAQTQAGQPPGAQQSAPSHALGHAPPMPQPSAAAQPNNPVQGQAAGINSHLPNPAQQPQMPH